MADDRQPSPDSGDSAGRFPDRRDDLDRTSAFDPSTGDADDATHGRPEETAPLPASGETAPQDKVPPPAADETVPLRAPDETVPPPAADETAPLAGPPTSWSGRAAVPGPQPAAVRHAAPEWNEVEGRAGRRWWLPVLAVIVALLLLAVLAYGIWLILESSRKEPGPILPSPSAATVTSATPRQTSAAPTTARPTTGATVQTVAVPPLVGQRESEARVALDRLGLIYRLEFRESDRPPGTVIETDPRAGTKVPVGTRVTLVIAESPPAPPSSASPTLTVSPTATP